MSYLKAINQLQKELDLIILQVVVLKMTLILEMMTEQILTTIRVGSIMLTIDM